MGLFERFLKKKVVEEPVKVEFHPPADGIYLPYGCTREADMIVVDNEYFREWLKQYPDSIIAASKMVAFLKTNYPAITRFRIKK